MLLATVVVIIATLLQITGLLLARKKVDMMLWVTFALVVVLGGATIWFHNPTFIKWKPSALVLGDGGGALDQPGGVRQEPAAGHGRRAARASQGGLAAPELGLDRCSSR